MTDTRETAPLVAADVASPRMPGRRERPGVPRAQELLVPGVLAALAAVLYLRGLGASSFFIDEATSLAEAHGSVAHVLRAVHAHETSPPTYALFLHYWIDLFGSHSEAVARLPSALAGIGLVVAVWYLARLLADAPTALLAGLLTLISPGVLEYAQQARVYVILMLAGTLTVIALVKAERESSRRWLIVAAGAGVATVSLHYFGWLIVGPGAIWLATRASISVRRRVAFCAALAPAGIAWVPELLGQFSVYARDGFTTSAASWAGLSSQHALAVLAAPLGDRGALAYAGQIAAVIFIATVAIVARPRAELVLRFRGLLLALVVIPVAAILLLGAAGKNVVLPRYAMIGVPFLVVATAAATRLLEAIASRVAAGAIMFVMLVGLLVSSAPANYWPDDRGVVRYMTAHWQAGDYVYPDKLVVGTYLPLAYYSATYLPGHGRVMSDQVYSPAVAATGISRPIELRSDAVAYAKARARRERLWIVANYVGTPPAASVLVPPGYRPAKVKDFPASISLRLVLAVPTTSSFASSSSSS
jgi:mannosyltransferase